MARALTSPQKALLRSPDLQVNALATFYLDEGTFRFCNEQSGLDLSDGVNTYIGANAFMDSVEIRATAALRAEQVTMLLDGNRMAQAGVADPARVLRDILGYLYQQRRVDYALAFRYTYSTEINLIIPAYAGKINSTRLIDREMDFPGDNAPRTVTYLEIVLDSLAARYNRATNRLRAHNDQLELDPTDNFYSFTQDIAQNERTVYWGKNAPFTGGGSVGNLPPGGGTGGTYDSGRFNYNQSGGASYF